MKNSKNAGLSQSILKVKLAVLIGSLVFSAGLAQAESTLNPQADGQGKIVNVPQKFVYEVFRTYHWAQSQSYNDFSYGDPNSYNGIHLVAVFKNYDDIPKRFLDKYSYRIIRMEVR